MGTVISLAVPLVVHLLVTAFQIRETLAKSLVFFLCVLCFLVDLIIFLCFFLEKAITGKVETITSYTAMTQGLAIATGRRMRTIGHLLGDIMATGATAVVAAAGRAGGISGVPHTGIRVISRVHTMIHRHQRPRGPLLSR